MACCKCCCGGVDCAEGDQGKCCCGGPSGTCCQAGEYCCNGACQSEPCDQCAIYDPVAGTATINAWKQSVGHSALAGGPFPSSAQRSIHPLSEDWFGPLASYGSYTAFTPIVIDLPPGQYELEIIAESRIDCRNQRAAVYEFTTSLTGATVFSVGTHFPCGDPWVQDSNRTATASTGFFCKPYGVNQITVTIQNYRVYTCCDNDLQYYETTLQNDSMWRFLFSGGECPCNPLP